MSSAETARRGKARVPWCRRVAVGVGLRGKMAALAFGWASGRRPRYSGAGGDSAGTHGARSHRVAVAEDAEGRG